MKTFWADTRNVSCVMVLVALAATAAAQGQANLPATAPTAQAPILPSVSQLPSANPPVQRSASHLAVQWDGVALRVEARNASLNAVLHEISLKTKMKVTGSAPDERVFGSYGPGPLNLVVPALLNGVAVNLLLTERAGGAADELVLTDRNGAATPPYVPTQMDAEGGSKPASPQFIGRLPQPGPRGPAGRTYAPGALPPDSNDPVRPDNGVSGRDNGVNGADNGQNGADNGVSGRDNGMNGTDNGLNNSNGAANSAPITNSAQPADSSAPASPNGVRTPQQIFEQLQQLRQSQSTQQ